MDTHQDDDRNVKRYLRQLSFYVFPRPKGRIQQ